MNSTLATIKAHLSAIQTKLSAFETDRSVALELFDYINNVRELNDIKTNVYRNYLKKLDKGMYDAVLAQKGFMGLIDAAAKHYATFVGNSNDPKAGREMFPLAVRRVVAEELEKYFMEGYNIGEHDWLR